MTESNTIVQLDLSKLSKEQVNQAFKIIKRIQKHGDPTIVNKRGRKQVSPEHKKAVWNAWYEKQKLLKKEAGQPVYEKKGRPFKQIQDAN
jgi:hypothetical protein